MNKNNLKSLLFNIAFSGIVIFINLFNILTNESVVSWANILFLIALICFITNLISCIIHLKRMEKNEDESENDKID